MIPEDESVSTYSTREGLMTHILIVQHAEKERLPGDPGLTPRGHKQADATARFIAGTVRIGAVLSSPLRRARETAEPISSVAGLPVVLDDGLRERMNWEPESTGQSIDEFLVEWAEATQDRHFAPVSGDSSWLAAKRFSESIVEHARKLPEGSTLVVVAHGGVTVDLLRTLAGDDAVHDQYPWLMERGIPSCALTWLSCDSRGLDVVQVADTSHLDAGLVVNHSIA